MIRLTAILIFAVFFGCASPTVEKSASGTKKSGSAELVCTFLAEIHAVGITDGSGGSFGFGGLRYDPKEIRSRRSGKLVIGFDAHWGVATTIAETLSAPSLFLKGDEWTFVIHSPVMSFGQPAEEMAGKVLKLDLYGTTQPDGSIAFLALEIHPEEPANQAAEPSRATVTPPAGAGDRASGAPGSP
jgi:hypothetical protein